MIEHISIKDFRSISSSEIIFDWITCLVGANDAGKSNVLRALNLFFNGETNPGEPFSFDLDFNSLADDRARRAPQVEIEIRFRLPPSYQRTDFPKEVLWKKVWRRDGEVKRMETIRYSNGAEFPSRSKVPTLLDRVRFTYIPAIKDKAFFADLQGRLYDVLASTAEEPLKTSATAFQTQLGEQLHGLLESLQQVFRAEATMRLPENLRKIFESLEINSGGIPLSRRGDGIKIRHIPMMLKFIAETRNKTLTQGGIRFTHIWGFEEPENNVEMSAAFEMASELVDLVSSSDHFQLLLTTHSPIFYRIDQQRPNCAPWLISHFVSKGATGSTFESRLPEEVDNTMGLMPIVAPYVAKAKVEFDAVQTRLKEVSDILSQRLPTVFVEGDNDRVVISKAFEVFSNNGSSPINICAGSGAYGGASALYSRSLAWLLTLRHRAVEDRVKSVSIFDGDLNGQREYDRLTADMARMKLDQLGFKIIRLQNPEHVGSLMRDGFDLNADLETFYTDAFWIAAFKANWLIPVKDISTRLSAKSLNSLAEGGANPINKLEGAAALRVKNRFSDDGKKKAAKKIAGYSLAEARVHMCLFQPLVKSISAHLGVRST